MANKSNMSRCFNVFNRSDLEWLVQQYLIPSSLNRTLPEKDTTIYPFVPGKIGVYTRMFDYCNYRLPLTKFLIRVLMFHEVHLSQMNPFGLAKMCQFELACRGLESDPGLDVFRAFYRLNRTEDWYTFEVRNKNATCLSWITSSLKDWKDRFLLVYDRCVPAEMAWRPRRSHLPGPLPEDFQFNKGLYAVLIKEAGRIQKIPEHILVMGRISTIWPEPKYFPTLCWNGEVMGLKDALRLKSFDSGELDIRATKTPKGDPSYLSIVNENLYAIRDPVAAGGQGGSGSTPPVQVVNVSPICAVSAAGSGKGKGTCSSAAKGSDSKVILYYSEHLSVEDKGVADEGDDAGDQPQISLKRHRNPFSKSDPNPKGLKKTKLATKAVILEDEADRVTKFSVVGDLLENLGAYLHGGKTPRDCSFTLPPSPLSFGGTATKLVADTEMLDPLIFKKTELSPSGKPTTGVESNVSRPSPQPFDGRDSASSSPLWYETEAVFICQELGSSDAMDVDLAEALEKYVPDWSLVNKDRIIDALSAKMSLFHISPSLGMP
ncbi:hypothetical protein Hanom_Chr15g01382981 [Helianthus anomalus]